MIAFDPSNQGATFSGNTMLPATLETREIVSTSPDTGVYVDGVRPIIERDSNAVVTAQIGHRKKLDDNVTYTAAKGVNPVTGKVDVRKEARYARFRLDISGTGQFNHATGVVPNVIDGSYR